MGDLLSASPTGDLTRGSEDPGATCQFLFLGIKSARSLSGLFCQRKPVFFLLGKTLLLSLTTTNPSHAQHRELARTRVEDYARVVQRIYNHPLQLIPYYRTTPKS